MVKFDVISHIRVKFALLSKIWFILTFDDNFDYVPDGISKKWHILLTVFCKDSESAIRFSNFPFWNFDLIWPFDLRYVPVGSQILTWENFWQTELIHHPYIGLVTSGCNWIMLFIHFWTLLISVWYIYILIEFRNV